jgi:SAM-dependent methyltransferase
VSWLARASPLELRIIHIIRGVDEDLNSNEYELRALAESGGLKEMFAYAMPLKKKGATRGGVHGAEFWLRRAKIAGHLEAAVELEQVITRNTKVSRMHEVNSPIANSQVNNALSEAAVDPLSRTWTAMEHRQAYAKKVSFIEREYKLPHSDFSDFQVLRDISKSDAISYAKKYGGLHLQELCYALQELFDGNKSLFRPKFEVDVLDVGCGPGMSRDILFEFGIHPCTYSCFDYADAFLWLAKELNNDSLGQFINSLYEMKSSELCGFIIMNHVQNQNSISEITLKTWAEQFKRIYPNGFYLLSIEPKFSEFKERRKLFAEKIREAEIEIRYKAQISCRGAFKAQFKSVSLWICGV